jgi:menaquinone-specific isochorismate synthase
LRDILHLATPITGTLPNPGHVLDLLRTLHPTPAVAGTPTIEARRWIARSEPTARGWYAAPIGWIDAAGDGLFNVALRSCLLHGQQADLYAGAGIVGASDPEHEYSEMLLKTKTLLSALGD